MYKGVLRGVGAATDDLTFDAKMLQFVKYSFLLIKYL